MSSPLPAPSGLTPTVRFLVVTVAAIGFLFDTYELLMFPVIGADALSELLGKPPVSDEVRLWTGRLLWISALCGGLFGLVGGYFIDRLGRKRVMIASIFLYSFSPVAASFSTELWHLILFRCTTFIGVCIEMVAAVTWLAELFNDKRTRELVIGWTLACASLGGILVTEVYNEILALARAGRLPNIPFPAGHDPNNVAWRFTLLTGLIPGALILLLMPFVPESRVWAERKRTGTLRRPSFGELFAPALLRTTIVTALLSACAYAAAFGALQQTPSLIAPGLPDLAKTTAELNKRDAALKAEREGLAKREEAVKARREGLARVKAELDKQPGDAAGKTRYEAAVAELAAQEAALKKDQAELSPREAALKKDQADHRNAIKARRGNIQRWQELGGLTGRILFAILLVFVPSRWLLRLFLIPGVVLFPVTYLELVKGEYAVFATAIFFCGLLTVAQMSYMSEYLPKVFPVHLRGTGGAFATNVGARMLGTMAATLNTEVLATFFEGPNPIRVAAAAAVIGGTAYLIALGLTFLLPPPRTEEPTTPAPTGPDAG